MQPNSVQDLINAGFYGYQGWGNQEALADYRATGGAGKGSLTNQTALGGGAPVGGGAMATYPTSAITQANQYLQPAIQQVQQGLSDTKARYQSILNSIKGQTETAVATEFGKRGVPTSSGIVQQAQAREVATNQAQGLAAESSATLPFYELLANLGLSQANAVTSATGGAGGAGDINWGNEFSNFVTSSTPSVSKPSPYPTIGKPVKLNQANKPIVTDTTQYGQPSSFQNILFPALDTFKRSLQSVAGGIGGLFK